MSNLRVPENDDGLEESYMLQDTSGKEGPSSHEEIILKVKELLEDLEEKLLKTTSQVGEGGSDINCAADGTGPGHYDEDTRRILMELALMFKERGVNWQQSEEQQVVPEGQATVNSEQSGSGNSSTLLDDNYINETHVDGPTSQSVEESTMPRNSGENAGHSTKTHENERLLTSPDNSISDAGTPKRKSDDSADPESSSRFQSFPKRNKGEQYCFNGIASNTGNSPSSASFDNEEIETESQTNSIILRDIEDHSGSSTSSSKDPKDVEISSLKKCIRKLQAKIQCYENSRQQALQNLTQPVPSCNKSF